MTMNQSLFSSFAHLICALLLLLLLSTSGLAQEYQSQRRAAGREAFQMYCLPCHGANGDGEGPIAQALNPPPTSFSAPVYKSMTDAELFRRIKEGGGASHNCPMMPDWQGVLRDDDIRSVVAYIRSLTR